jgi:hypothetical protein
VHGVKRPNPEERVMAENKSGGSSATPIVGILAAVALIVLFAWFFVIRDAKTPVAATAAPQAQTDSNNDINIKVNLPDSVVVNP